MNLKRSSFLSRVCLSIVLILMLAISSSVDNGSELFPGNILLNPDFDQSAPDAPSIAGVEGTAHWIFGLNGGNAGGKAIASMDGGALKVSSITDAGRQVYAIQVMQAEVNVVADTSYRLQFDARSEQPRSIKVKVGGLADRNWVDYTRGTGDGTEFKLTTEMTTYSLEFDMTHESDPRARFEFQLGLNKSTVWIDKVSLVPISGPGAFTFTTEGLVKNGEFSSNAASWKVLNPASATGGSSGELTLEARAGELVARVSKVGAAVDQPAFVQEELSLIQGHSYQVSFKARSDKQRMIMVRIGNALPKAPFFEGHAPDQVFQLGAAMQPYTFTFTMRKALSFGEYTSIVFGLGTVEGSAVPAQVTIDDVTIVDLDVPVVTFAPVHSQDVVKNGNFEVDTAYWSMQTKDGLSVVADELRAVPTAQNDVLRQGGMSIERGSAYTIGFIARSSIPGKVSMNFNVSPASTSSGSASLSQSIKTILTKEISLGVSPQYYQFYMQVPADLDATLTQGEFALALGQLVPAAQQKGVKAEFGLDRISVRKTGAWMDSTKTTAERVNLLMASMSLEEKAAQMVQGERSAVRRGDILSKGIGSVLSGGGSVPSPNTPEGWIKMINTFQAEAMATRIAIPMIYGVDAVHGHGNVYGATIFPHNIGLGATRNPALIEAIGKATALEVAATGIQWTFGPCVAVTRDERWGRVYESFGESPELQTLLSAAAVRGMQGTVGSADWMKNGRIIATAKHFIGDGGAEWRTGEGTYTIDRGDIKTLTLDQLKAIHGEGYIQTINAGVGTIMASFNLFKGQHMHANKALLTDYLKGPKNKGGLGFEGFVIGDWDAMSLLTEVPGDWSDKVIFSFNSGLDMSMEQSKWKQVIDTLIKGVKDGKITMARIDDAVRRILTVKFNAGIFEAPWSLPTYASTLGSAEHRAIAAQAVKESLVLLKNDKDVLPLRQGAKVYVTGPLADNVGLQSGGWTIQWQGGSDKGSTRLTPGTSILDGFKSMAAATGGTIITDDAKAKEATVAVVVIGELPYAEGVGDVPLTGSMGLTGNVGKLAPGTNEALQKALSLKIPVVVIVVSGRPLIISNELKSWNAAVAAWLPGSEGGAIAEVIYGKENFKGVLPITWPRSLDQLPINVGDADLEKKNPLFPYGYGLKMKLDR